MINSAIICAYSFTRECATCGRGSVCRGHLISVEPPHDKTNKMACAPSEDSDQLPSLIRVFAVRMKKAQVLSYPLIAQRRLWSDSADAQADLSLRWAHRPFCWFCHEAAQFMVHNLFSTSKAKRKLRGFFSFGVIPVPWAPIENNAKYASFTAVPKVPQRSMNNRIP